MRILHYVEIENFKRFGEIQHIELEHPTVLIGPNNCGIPKSSSTKPSTPTSSSLSTGKRTTLPAEKKSVRPSRCMEPSTT